MRGTLARRQGETAIVREEITADATLDGSEGLLATIVRASAPGALCAEGVHPLTEPRAGLQAVLMRHPAGHAVPAHAHREVARPPCVTGEGFHLRRGTVAVDFYTSAGEWVASRQLFAGDYLVIVAGGHGFRFLEESELVEFKTGPYLGRELDKYELRG